MTRDTLKGFIFGALIMLITPAIAMQSEPQPVAASTQEAVVADDTLPYFRLTYADAEEALGQALAERGAGVKITASIANRGEEYVFSYKQPISVEIRGLKFDANSRRFSANLVSLSGKEVISAKAVSGRFDEMVEVPVLKRSLRAGEIIKQEDIELRDYAKARSRDDTITDVASLVGKSPERVISAGRPIRVQELEQPRIVKKNDLVKMVYNQGSMSISTSGQAVTDGIKGSVIGVRNIASNKVIQATVQDANTVIIDSGEMRTSSIGTGGVYEN